MDWMADSNILLRGMDRADALYPATRQAVRMLLGRGERLCFTLQGLAEFWAVSTRPATARGGLGLTVVETDRRVRAVERYFTFLVDTPEVRAHWRRLIVTHQVRGVQVHDARVVASMLAHNVTHLLTFNTVDFRRHPEIVVAHPQDVLDGEA